MQRPRASPLKRHDAHDDRHTQEDQTQAPTAGIGRCLLWWTPSSSTEAAANLCGCVSKPNEHIYIRRFGCDFCHLGAHAVVPTWMLMLEALRTELVRHSSRLFRFLHIAEGVRVVFGTTKGRGSSMLLNRQRSRCAVASWFQNRQQQCPPLRGMILTCTPKYDKSMSPFTENFAPFC